uniref:Otopetrin 1 n=1 Tax=Fundulus heteroclitus TaxID=8078 RepID=A0A3Q2QAZ4_FUNHE
MMFQSPGGLNIMSLNKYCQSSSSSSSSSSIQDKKVFAKLKLSLSGDYPRKNAELLSAQYGINLLLVGVALMLAIAHHGDPSVEEKDLLSFTTALMILQLIWMMWYILVRHSQRNTRTERDVNATTCWIRGGVTLLAVLSLIMDALKIGYFVGYRSCLSAVLAVYPVIHATHTIAQPSGFLLFLSTSCLYGGINNCCFNNVDITTGFLLQSPCNCTTSTCSVFSQSFTYLFPFNIEYHIFVSALLFVMWKNIGRTIDVSNKKSLVTKTRGLSLGPILGLLALGGTIGVLVLYITRLEGSVDVRQSAISMFYIYGIVMLAAMCSAGAIGLLIYRADHMPLDASKNPSRKLDTELLFGSSLSSWFMSWCSIVSVFSSHDDPPHRWTNLIYSLLIVLEKYIQNLFIIESLYRQQESVERADPELPAAPEVFSVTSSLPPFNGIINQAYESPGGGCSSMENEQEENGQVYGCQRKQSDVPLPVHTEAVEPHNMKRLVLKNLSIMLLLCNISLWILPAFGCRPQYDNGLEEETFGFTTWTTILNFAIPLNLFYRMHSVASLFEVFRRV